MLSAERIGPNVFLFRNGETSYQRCRNSSHVLKTKLALGSCWKTYSEALFLSKINAFLSAKCIKVRSRSNCFSFPRRNVATILTLPDKLIERQSAVFALDCIL